MSQLQIGNSRIEVDPDGFLTRPDEWNEEIAAALAEREGLEPLSKSKLSILNFLREYFQKNHSFPILRYVCKKIGASSNCITEEFVDPMKAWKIAGLPKPPQVFFTSFDGKNYFANPFY
ncbi:MAG: hypothetical protein VR65_09745 [Desulfobulbaceae bacterium BRH_c16a]|nr:MAG: hypothetical protein VR65_09745 [Desulfobulbaceae bacterium BRH_c16a]